MDHGATYHGTRLSSGHRTSGRDFYSRYRRLWWYCVIFTAFVSLTPLLSMVVINYYQYKGTLSEEIVHPLARIVATSSRFIDRFLEQRKAALVYTARRESHERLSDPKELGRILVDLNRSFGGFLGLAVLSSKGVQQANVGHDTPDALGTKHQAWFREASVRGVHVSEVFLDIANRPRFVIAVRKENAQVDSFQVLRATIDLETVVHHLASLDLQPTSDAYLVNRKGILQTPSRHEGNILDECSVALPAVVSQPEVTELTDRLGRPRLLGYTPIGQSPFIFILLREPGHVVRAWLSLSSNMLWLLGVSVVVLMTMIIVGSTYLVNRIREADFRRDKALHSIAYTNKMASIGRMAAGVAHEINNPLAIINENAGLIRDLAAMKNEPPKKERLVKIAEIITNSVERCSTITHRLLGFAKRMDPLIERIHLGSLVEEVLSFQGKEAENRGIAINVDIPDRFPAINSDRGQLQQVFLNILSNAFAAVEDGGRIDIALKQDDEKTVSVTISDDGPGIPSEVIDRVFEPFFSTKADYGTGLGLSITFGIVEKLGGRIEVQSEVGQGASFIVRLPLSS